MPPFRQKLRTDQLYVPTTAELNDSIASFLLEHKDPDAKKVREFLVQENKSWSVPERRVRKFVKRQSQPQLTVTNSSTEDDDSRSMSSAVKTRVKGMMKGAGRIFGTVKKKAADNEGVPVFEIQTTTSSILSPPDRERADSIDEELLPPTPQLYTPNRESRIPGEEVVVEEVRKIDVAKDRELPMNESPIYSDDNDGKKDRLCAPCEGCIVL